MRSTIWVDDNVHESLVRRDTWVENNVQESQIRNDTWVENKWTRNDLEVLDVPREARETQAFVPKGVDLGSSGVDQRSSNDDMRSSSEPVCRLNRTLYGLKQSPRMWNKKIDEFLVSTQGFTRLNADHSIYIQRHSSKNSRNSENAKSVFAIIVLYMDDLLLLTETPESMLELKAELNKSFEMTDCGEIHHFLGLKVNCDQNQITLDQEHFVDQILSRFGMLDCKPVSTPLDASVHLEQADKEANVDSDSDLTIYYWQIIGSLMFLMMEMRPDIAAAVSIVSQFATNPIPKHIQAAKRILQYLKGTKGYKLYLGGTNKKLVGYCDTNWGNEINSRKFTSGYLFYLGGGVISWSSKRQPTVALSSTEAEYMALTHATKEAIWL